MRRRPWALVVLAFFHLLAPIGNIALNAVLAKRDLLDYFQLALTPEYLAKNWIMIVTPIVAGVAIYACKKWSFYVYLASITILFVFSYVGFLSKDGSLSVIALLAVYLVNISVVLYFLVPAVRNVYFDRRMRWWEAQPRYRCDYQAQWKFENNEVVHDGQIGNLSINGLFLKSEIYPKDEDIVEITIPFQTKSPAQFKGKVIFHNTANKIGFGVQFDHDKNSKNQAQDIVAELEKSGLQINRLEIRPEDTLTYWARTLITTGKGLFPKS